MMCDTCKNLDPDALAQCLVCKKHFCNSKSNGYCSDIVMHATETEHVSYIFPGNTKPKCRACGVTNIFCLLGANGHFYCKIHCIKSYGPVCDDMEIKILPNGNQTMQ